MTVNLRWQSSTQPAQLTRVEQGENSPLVAYIKSQRASGTSDKRIMESLMQQGYPYRNIKDAFKLVNLLSRGMLDWRTVTSINETGRMIRKDIRANRVSYSRGMRLLLQARDNLRSVISNPRDKRLKQIQDEIRITKKLFLKTHANPYMVKKYTAN